MFTLPAVSLACAFGLPMAQGESKADQHVPYVVLSAVPEGDPFDGAAQLLAKGHDAPIERFDPADLEPLREMLVRAAPANVAIVLRPEQLDFDLARRLLQLSTEIDDDPFVDFAFGYITGSTPKSARALVKSGLRRKPMKGEPKLAMVAGGVDQSRQFTRDVKLRDEAIPCETFYCAGEDRFPEDGRDVKFVKGALRKLSNSVDVLMFAGHGYPDRVVGGPAAADLGGLKLKGAVALNVACYTGVTSGWFESDYGAGVERMRQCEAPSSFALRILDAGVVGYTAYVCPRPAGPELDCDRAALIADGLSLGEARRRDYDKTVLGFMGFGEERMELAPIEDGSKLERGGDVVRTMMLEGATGGIVFGDPACVPFAGLEGQSPVAIEVEPGPDGGLNVRANTDLAGLYLHCNDPTARMDGNMAMKVHGRVPLGDLQVGEVVVEGVRVGRKELPSRVLWAVETDQGERFLQMKVNFPRGERMRGDLDVTVRIEPSAGGEPGRLAGGTVAPPTPAARRTPQDLRSIEATDALLNRAAARQVGTEALHAALVASASQMPGDGADHPEDAIPRLAAFKSEGFRAVCALLDVGQSHYRTHELLETTWQPGDEDDLLALAKGPALPNYASWAVMRGLGTCDTPEVREYLLGRLKGEENAGIYMSAAAGLARLGELGAVDPIGERLLEQRPAWGGVAPHMIRALEELGGDDAIAYLEKIGDLEDEALSSAALAALRRLGAR